MSIHKEGRVTILITFISLIIINFLIISYVDIKLIHYFFLFLSAVFFYIILYFFRKPKRIPYLDANKIIASADGKLVAIEEITETEYFNDKRIQVSVFMSPLNVHINWAPVSGRIDYYKYHPGKHLVAWHPKSSTDNERTTIIFETEGKSKIMLRQIAGALARRIVCYPKDNMNFKQGEEIGFIKFGSRVDLILPLDAKIKVKLDDTIIGNKTVIAELL